MANLTIYKHPTDESMVIARYEFGDRAGTIVSDEFLIADLPVGRSAARDYIVTRLRQSEPNLPAYLEIDDRDERTDTVEAFINQAQNELDYLASTIPTVDAMTNIQVRNVVKRLCQENEGVIRALLYLARRL